MNQAYLREQANWYWTVRPYRIANIDPYVLTATAERALKPGIISANAQRTVQRWSLFPREVF